MKKKTPPDNANDGIWIGTCLVGDKCRLKFEQKNNNARCLIAADLTKDEVEIFIRNLRACFKKK